MLIENLWGELNALCQGEIGCITMAACEEVASLHALNAKAVESVLSDGVTQYIMGGEWDSLHNLLTVCPASIRDVMLGRGVEGYKVAVTHKSGRQLLVGEDPVILKNVARALGVKISVNYENGRPKKGKTQVKASTCTVYVSRVADR